MTTDLSPITAPGNSWATIRHRWRLTTVSAVSETWEV
ncbi:hypothetical protein FHS22_002125 [Planomonospora venezuelensis]|uniref:Uncharacterized protein n=1 Tax=Planomonospora venezuelensis TaxID=1999 RepID=A0A841D3B7_PLAVE|nr:hypothetical protein [Planomonospora venezuelensis]